MKFHVIEERLRSVEAFVYDYDSNSTAHCYPEEIENFLKEHKSESNVFIHVKHCVRMNNRLIDDIKGYYYNVYDFKKGLSNVEIYLDRDGSMRIFEKENEEGIKKFLFYIFPDDKKEFFEKLFETVDIPDEDKLSLILEYPQLAEFINK